MEKTIDKSNKNIQKIPYTVELTTEQKLEFLANLIVDRITEDQNKGRKLLKQIGGTNVARTITTA